MSAQDSIIRIALLMLAADPTSPCTEAQRTWIVQRMQSLAPLTVRERAALKAPLLEWYGKKFPRTYSLVAQQFDTEDPIDDDRDAGHAPADSAAAAFRAGRVTG